MNQFHPWLFDSRDAWQKAVADSRWTYDIPMSRFMAIYLEYRGTTHGAGLAHAFMQATAAQPFTMASAAPTPPAQQVLATATSSSNAAGQILSQNEIDSLLSSLTQ